MTDEDTAAPGRGSAELQWMVSNVLAKSDIWNTRTKAALDDGSPEPPTGAEGWYQQLVAYIDSLRGDGVSEEQIAAAVEAYLADNPVDVPVTSVNGKIGAVQLTAADVGALPTSTVIPTVPDNVSAFRNDAGYLTEHQDISGKLDASELPTAINTALAQAKASGEFDGEPGAPGYTPVKGTDYFTEEDKTELVNAVLAALPAAEGANY